MSTPKPPPSQRGSLATQEVNEMEYGLQNAAPPAYNMAIQAQSQAPGATLPPPQPQPTDMQTYVQRTHEAMKRLHAIHDSLLGVVGRLYGEGQAVADGKIGPRAAGLSSELTEALSGIESIAEQIDHAVTRLSLFA
jgi:hypothetical protein